METRIRRAIGSPDGAPRGAFLVPARAALRALGSVTGEILSRLDPARTDEFVRCLRESVDAHRAAGTGSLLEAEPKGRA